ncbi:hypothetical protein ACIP4S_13140 [Streptomyces chartreusis]|uniref:zinc finger domain-containing protein n=1 Tax=Streptomyces chartreusis TaxID=1969 RepID=UPI00380BE1A4
MTQEPINTLQFARDLSRLEDHLRWLSSGGGNGERDESSALADALLTLIEQLTNGREATPAIAAAIRVLDDKRTENRDRFESRQAALQAYSERRRAEEEVTQKVECPYCGAGPSDTCRSTGSNGAYARSESHKARFRLARSLNDGVGDASLDSAKRDAHARDVLVHAPDEALRQWAEQELDLNAYKAGQISLDEYKRRWPEAHSDR